MSDTVSRAEEIAATATGLRPDQVRAAVNEYRAAAKSLEGEPVWEAISHMSGKDWGGHVYGAEGTEVYLQVEEWKERGDWKSERCYTFKDKRFELFAEARAAELALSTRQRPHVV